MLLTADLGFANTLRFPLGTHAGILTLRFPNEVSIDLMTKAVLGALRDLRPNEIEGGLLVVEPGRVRLRKA